MMVMVVVATLAGAVVQRHRWLRLWLVWGDVEDGSVGGAGGPPNIAEYRFGALGLAQQLAAARA